MKKLSMMMIAAMMSASSSRGSTFETTTLKNGLDVVTLESTKVPLVTIVLAFKAGAMTETRATNGLTHLWEHMFFKGNKTLANQEAFNRRVRQLGIVFNGDTAAEKVRYYITLPAVFLEEGIKFIADAIMTPRIDDGELKKEIQVVLDEYDRSASNPGFDLYNLVRRMIYGELDYLRDPLGHRPTILATTKAQLLKIKDEVFVPANAALIVGGDFERSRLVESVQRHFGAWETPKSWKRPQGGKFPPFPKETVHFVMTRPLAQNAQVGLVFDGPTVRSDPKDSFAADILVNLLAQRSGRFYQKFVDSGLTFASGFSYYTQGEAGDLRVYASCKPEKAEQVRKELLEELPRFADQDYFTDAQWDDVRRQLSIEHVRELNKVSEYTKTLAFWWAVAGLDYYASYLDNLRSMTRDNLSAFLEKYLKGKSHISYVFLSPEDAKRVGLQDTSQELVRKHLSHYEHINKGS